MRCLTVVYGPADSGEFYPAETLTGTGEVKGRAAACITPEWLVRFHIGYEVDAADRADVLALCERLSLPIPIEDRRAGGEGSREYAAPV